MPLPRYGVLLGANAGYHRDPPNDFGRFFHGHIDVQTPGQLFNTAIDVDTNRAGVQVQWRVLHLRVPEWLGIFGLQDGFHPLVSNAASGAVDYVRDPRLREFRFGARPGAISPLWKRLPDAWRTLWHGASGALNFAERTLDIIDVTPPWKTGTDLEALADLEAMIVDARRVVIFGDMYPASGTKPPGLHDIHYTQGDPPGPFWGLDGIWQDGLTIVTHSDSTASAFMNKFSPQSLNTDDEGHPVGT